MARHDDYPTDPIDSKTAARILKRHVSALYRYVQQGRLPAWRIAGGPYVFSEALVRALRRRVGPKALSERQAMGHAEAVAYMKTRPYWRGLFEAKEGTQA